MVVDGLNLQPSGRTVVRTVGQGSDFNEYEVNTYLVNLFLPNNVVVGAVPADLASSELHGAGILYPKS